MAVTINKRGSWILEVNDDTQDRPLYLNFRDIVLSSDGDFVNITESPISWNLEKRYNYTDVTNTTATSGADLCAKIGELFDGGAPVEPGTVQLGTVGTLAGSSLGVAPFSFAYDNSFATWIIEASEISAISSGQQIDSIELYFGSMSNSSYFMASQRIYMGYTTLNNWTGNLPNVGHSGGTSTVTNRTYVKTSFSKTYTSAEEGTWLTFSFTTPYVYDGTSNIVIDWENRDGSYSFGGPKFHIENKSGSVAYKRRDGSYPSGSCFLDAERPIMKLNYS